MVRHPIYSSSSCDEPRDQNGTEKKQQHINRLNRTATEFDISNKTRDEKKRSETVTQLLYIVHECDFNLNGLRNEVETNLSSFTCERYFFFLSLFLSLFLSVVFIPVEFSERFYFWIFEVTRIPISLLLLCLYLFVLLLSSTYSCHLGSICNAQLITTMGS